MPGLVACLLLILLLHPCFVQAQQAPTITGQPTNQTVAVGGTATFEATAAGTAPLSYQWLFNSTNLADVGRITGATSNVLAIASVQTNDAGPAQAGTPNGATTRAERRLAVRFGRNERQQTAGNGPRQKPAACLCRHGRQASPACAGSRSPGIWPRRAVPNKLNLIERSERGL
jgi:hypothetical protein